MAREGTVAEQILSDRASTDQQTLRVSIRRTPPAPEVHTFDVPFTPGMSVFNVLEKVRDTLDPSLAIPAACQAACSVTT